MIDKKFAKGQTVTVSQLLEGEDESPATDKKDKNVATVPDTQERGTNENNASLRQSQQQES